MKIVNKSKILRNAIIKSYFSRKIFHRMLKFSSSDGSHIDAVLYHSPEDDGNKNFEYIWKKKWDELHNSDVFRYKLKDIQEKVVGGKYLLQLNPDRRMNRRPPDDIVNVCQPFDESKFNFTKVSSKEILFNIEMQNDPNRHTLMVNVSPITRYHSLLCPSIDLKLPQVITERSLQLVLEIMILTQNRDLRIGFNSLCAMASVNHLHYHLFLESHDLPVESIKCKNIKGPLYFFDEPYPVPAFCFEVASTDSINDLCKDIYKLIEHFIKNHIAHNIFITRGKSLLPGEQKSEVVRVVIWPRKSSAGFKKLTAFYIALLELSGWFPVYTQDDFYNLTKEDLEKELSKWKLDDVDTLYRQAELLY